MVKKITKLEAQIKRLKNRNRFLSKESKKYYNWWYFNKYNISTRFKQVVGNILNSCYKWGGITLGSAVMLGASFLGYDYLKQNDILFNKKVTDKTIEGKIIDETNEYWMPTIGHVNDFQNYNACYLLLKKDNTLVPLLVPSESSKAEVHDPFNKGDFVKILDYKKINNDMPTRWVQINGEMHIWPEKVVAVLKYQK